MDRNLRVLGVGSGLRSFGLTFVGPFAALYLDLVGGLPLWAIGVALAGISVPPLVWSPWAGGLADRVGRRPILVLSLYGEALSMGGVAVAIDLGSVGLFLAAFVAAGLLATTGGPALSAYVADLTVGSERTLGFTWLRIGTNVGFALGVAAGGLVLAFEGFRNAAVVATVVLVGMATYVTLALDPSPYDRAPRSAPAPATSTPGRSTGRLREVARDRLFVITSVAFGLAVLVTSQWGVAYSLFAGHTLHLSYAEIGFGFALNGVLVVVGQASTTRAVLGHRHTTIGILGTACYAAGFLALGGAALAAGATYAIFLAATAVITLGENLIMIPISTLPSNLAPRESIGLYNGAFGTILGVGGLFATVIGPVAIGVIAGPVLLWLVLVAPIVPAALLLRWVGRRLPERPNRA